MKAVLVSLKPYYYYLVGEGIKKIEVRKGMPKTEDWNRDTFFYMSKDEKSFSKIPKEFQEKYRKHFGKVGLRFVCDRIDNYECELWNDEAYELIRQFNYDEYGDIEYEHGAENNENCEMLNKACLTWQDIRKYLGKGFNTCYAWHITDLKVYDKPQELFDFANYNKYQVCKEKNCFSDNCWICPNNAIVVRPPQDWCYVEV